MSSYKHYLRGLLNDVEIYGKFNYFYMPKYVTSTGRMFTRTFFLQLQGNKLAKMFITFKKQQALSENDLPVFITALNKVFPQIDLKEIFLEKYIKHQKALSQGIMYFVIEEFILLYCLWH